MLTTQPLNNRNKLPLETVVRRIDEISTLPQVALRVIEVVNENDLGAIANSVITEKHKGTLDFETEIGRGTTFIVRLPISGESSFSKGAKNEEAYLVC